MEMSDRHGFFYPNDLFLVDREYLIDSDCWEVGFLCDAASVPSELWLQITYEKDMISQCVAIPCFAANIYSVKYEATL